MVDHIKILLLNSDNVPGYRKVVDKAVDAVLKLFGFTGDITHDTTLVDMLMPLVLAPDLAPFRTYFDQRISPLKTVLSVYRHTYDVSLTGIWDNVLSDAGWWTTSEIFNSDDQVASAVLAEMRNAARCADAPFALGAVLICCAYRRLLLQGDN